MTALYRQALAIHEEACAGASPGPLGDTCDVLARLARALVNACRGAEAAAVYFDLARGAAAAGEEDLELRLRGAEQLLASGHRVEGRRALAGVLDELGLSPPATRAGALWRLLRRRAWVRLRGLKTRVRGARVALAPRERLRLDACRVAWMTSELPPEYFTRYQVLALKTGDPRYVGLALVVEITIAVMRGQAGAPRTARLFDELAAVAEASADPLVLGQAQSVRALVALVLGQWSRGREHAAQAMKLLRERCLGASYETTLAAVYYFGFLLWLGDFRALVRELPPLVREAEERADHFMLVTLRPFVVLMSLALDQPAAAREHVERGTALWTTAEVDVRAMAGRGSLAEIELYEGDGAAAYRWIDEDWRRVISLPFTRLGFVRARALSIHALSALAACHSGGPDRGPDREIVRAAARDVRGLRALRMPWTSALARSFEAAIALAAGARAEACAELERAQPELLAAGMDLHATLARRRLGELTGGAAGARAIAEADAWLAGQGVRAPERLARVFMPEVQPRRLLAGR
jgi:eukaryotic-like serine/threonine-protein kinase